MNDRVRTLQAELRPLIERAAETSGYIHIPGTPYALRRRFLPGQSRLYMQLFGSDRSRPMTMIGRHPKGFSDAMAASRADLYIAKHFEARGVTISEGD